MPKVKLPHNGKIYTVDQRTLDAWDSAGIAYKVIEKDVLQKPEILKDKKAESKEIDAKE